MTTADPVLSDRMAEAFALALALHRRQARKGTSIPYISHLMAVSALVLEHGGREAEAVAALLHDAVEDQGGTATLERIRTMFGEEVAGIVAACSEPKTADGHGEERPWRERKEAYLHHLAHEASSGALLVAAADKLHNLSCMLEDHRRLGERFWTRFNAGKEEQLWYYRSVLAILESRADIDPRLTAIVERLTPLVNELERRIAPRE